MGKNIVRRSIVSRGAGNIPDRAAGQSGGVFDQLRAVSDDWLAKRSGGEKGFSLGFFEPRYIARFPIAVIEQGGRIVAFANLWLGAQRFELSTDMMRCRQSRAQRRHGCTLRPRDVVGKGAGLPMVRHGHGPALRLRELVGHASSWNRLASFLYEHGENVYNFKASEPSSRNSIPSGSHTISHIRAAFDWRACSRMSRR